MAWNTSFDEPEAVVYVPSSSGLETYQCTRFGKRWECECDGYRVKHQCPHIQQAAAAVAGKKIPGVKVDFARRASSQRVARLYQGASLQDPCLKPHSLAWIESNGDTHVLGHEVHPQWAFNWMKSHAPGVLRDIKKREGLMDIVDDFHAGVHASKYLLERGWIQVTTLFAIRAFVLSPSPAWKSLVDIYVNAADKCVDAEDPVVIEGERGYKRVPLAKIVDEYGTSAQNDAFYAGLNLRSASSVRVAWRYAREQEHKPGDAWKVPSGWRGRNKIGPRTFDTEEEARAYAKGKSPSSMKKPSSKLRWNPLNPGSKKEYAFLPIGGGKSRRYDLLQVEKGHWQVQVEGKSVGSERTPALAKQLAEEHVRKNPE